MADSAVVELHTSPPAYGEEARDPYCISAQRLLALSGVSCDVVSEAANTALVPAMVIFGETMSGDPHLNEISGATPAEGFAAIEAFLKACGASAGPVARLESLPSQRHGQAVSLRTYFDSVLMPPLDWARANQHRASHRAELAKSAGILKRLLMRQTYSISHAIQSLETRAHDRHMLSATDAVELSVEGYNAAETLLKASTTPWLLSAQGPTVLDVVVSAMLLCHKTQPMLWYELQKKERVVAWVERCKAHTETSRIDVRPLVSVERQANPYEEGRLVAVVTMATIFGVYCTYFSSFLRRVIRPVTSILTLASSYSDIVKQYWHIVRGVATLTQ